jgi:LacI family transcriptional regulator
MPPRSPVRLRDVAARAGVSPATVSRALSTPGKVRPEALERVLAAVRDSGYMPDGAARALRSRRTLTVGALVPTLDNAIFASAIHALQDSLKDAGYNLLVACHDYDVPAETRIARSLLQRGIDGMVLVGLDHDKTLFDLLRAHRIPYVLTWALDPSGGHTCVGFENREAAARIADYLLALGHRKIAMIAGETLRNDRARERVIGVREALAAAGIRLTPKRLVEVPYTFEAARAAFGRVVGSGPTAIICGNDVLAIGALAEARDRGLRVPQDLSITGFDDLPISSLVTPALTTVRVPTQRMGEQAAALLLSQMARPAPGRQTPQTRAGKVEALPVELIVRESTGPA